MNLDEVSRCYANLTGLTMNGKYSRNTICLMKTYLYLQIQTVTHGLPIILFARRGTAIYGT